MKNLITVYLEDEGFDPPGVTSYLISYDGWVFINRGEPEHIRLINVLEEAMIYLEGVKPGRKSSPTPAPPPEQTCLPKPRPCPHYYEVAPGLELASLIGGWSFNLGAAAKYLFRAGKKPGNRAQDDLAKAVDYLLLEIQRLDALDRRRPLP
jgi:hypothetical protein